MRIERLNHAIFWVSSICFVLQGVGYLAPAWFVRETSLRELRDRFMADGREFRLPLMMGTGEEGTDRVGHSELVTSSTRQPRTDSPDSDQGRVSPGWVSRPRDKTTRTVAWEGGRPTARPWTVQQGPNNITDIPPSKTIPGSRNGTTKSYTKRPSLTAKPDHRPLLTKRPRKTTPTIPFFTNRPLRPTGNFGNRTNRPRTKRPRQTPMDSSTITTPPNGDMMGPIRGGTSGQRRRRQDTERPEQPTETADKAEKGTDIVIIIAGKPPPKKPSDDPAGGRGDFKQPKQELENGALLDDSTGSQDHSGHSDVLDTDMLGSALPEGGGKTEKEMATKKGGEGLMYLTAGLWYGRVCVNTRKDLHMGGMDPGTEWCTMYIRTNASTFDRAARSMFELRLEASLALAFSLLGVIFSASFCCCHRYSGCRVVLSVGALFVSGAVMAVPVVHTIIEHFALHTEFARDRKWEHIFINTHAQHDLFDHWSVILCGATSLVSIFCTFVFAVIACKGPTKPRNRYELGQSELGENPEKRNPNLSWMGNGIVTLPPEEAITQDTDPQHDSVDLLDDTESTKAKPESSATSARDGGDSTSVDSFEEAKEMTSYRNDDVIEMSDSGYSVVDDVDIEIDIDVDEASETPIQ